MDPIRASLTHLAIHYECQVCYDYAQPPIFQCRNGHVVCSICSPKLKCCPTCKSQLGFCRNLVMEKMLDTIIFPCKHSNEGCKVTTLLGEMSAHLEECLYIPTTGIKESCPWEGAVGNVVKEIQLKNPKIRVTQGKCINYRITKANLRSRLVDGFSWSTWCHLLCCFGHPFFFCVLKKEKSNNHYHLFAAVLLIGSPNLASKFKYKIELQGHQPEKIYESKMLSILNKNFRPVVLDRGLQVFDSAASQLFLVKDELNFEVKIVKSSY